MTYFTPTTDPHLFKCPCGACDVAPSQWLLDCLDALRDAYGHALIVTSGPRCPAHNDAVGGQPLSDHLTGEGADLSIPAGWERYRLVKSAMQLGITRIGVATTFVHIGVSLTLPQNVLWTYPSRA